MSWSNIIESDNCLNSKLVKTNLESNILPTLSPNLNKDMFAKVIKCCLNLITHRSDIRERCIIIRYLGWLCSTNSELVLVCGIPFATILLDKFIEFYEENMIDVALKWIEHLTGYTYSSRFERQPDKSSTHNQLINWDLTEIDTNFELFSGFWFFDNVPKIEMGTVHEQLPLIGLIELVDHKNTDIHDRSLNVIKTLISMNSNIHLLDIGNDSCFLRSTTGNTIFLTTSYQQLTNSDIIENMSDWSTDQMKLYIYTGNHLILDNIKKKIGHLPIKDRVDNYIYDLVNKHLITKFLGQVNDFTICHNDLVTINELLAFLKHINGVLTGGFLLGSILDEYQFGTDIDLFVPIFSRNESYIESLISSYRKLFEPICFIVTSEPNYAGLSKIARILTAAIGYTPIQIILVDVSEVEGNLPVDKIVNYIHTNFDLDICTSALSADKFYHPRGGIDSLIEKKTFLRYLGIINRSKKLTTRYMKYLNYGVSITLNETCEICHDRHSPIDLKLECGHYYHDKCLSYMSKYKAGDKYNSDKHKCVVCQNYIIVDGIIQPMIDHLTPEQLDVYEFCAKCHQFRDPSLFVDSVCDYCNSNIEIYRQFNILNCPNCGLELIRYTGCSGMCCCLYGGHCQGYGYVCKHGYTDNVRFCGYRWDIRPSDDHESDDHESDDHGSDDHGSDDHESNSDLDN